MGKRIFVTGASGFVAEALIPKLVQDGVQVFALVHKTMPSQYLETVHYVHSVQEMHSEMQKTGDAHLDAVIHLAGAGIADRPWTDKRRAQLQDSRWALIDRLHQSINDYGIGVSKVLGASAIGIYGDGKDQILDESAARGQGFAADLCAGVEQRLANHSAELNAKWYAMRIGVVLGPKGGMLAKLSTPSKLGLGTVMGSGEQWLGWIDRQDLVGGICHLLQSNMRSGPVNLTSPNPVPWADFAKALAGFYGRKARIFVPEFMLAPLGELKTLFLDSARVVPKALLDDGFTFTHSKIEQSLSVNL